MAITNVVRFDWAIKKLLRNKANYDVLEGFLSVLLGRQMKIHRFLDSESNQDNDSDKFNRVDMLVEDENGEILLIEVQNDRQLDYFHRMLYGTSKTISEYIGLGDEYSKIKKIYSINIVYFNLGQGSDYVYKGVTSFKGLHDNTLLNLTKHQKDLYKIEKVEEIFPEYYLLRVEKFNQYAKNSLDEWISFLKTGEIDDSFSAQGLPQARQKLQFEKMSEEERKAYKQYLENLRYANSVMATSHYEGMVEGEKKGRAEGEAIGRAEGEKAKAIETARKMKAKNYPIEDIAEMTGLSAEEIAEL